MRIPAVSVGHFAQGEVEFLCQKRRKEEEYPFFSSESDSLEELFSLTLTCWELLVTKKGLIREVFGQELNWNVRSMLTDAMLFQHLFEECAAVIEKSLETDPDAKGHVQI